MKYLERKYILIRKILGRFDASSKISPLPGFVGFILSGDNVVKKYYLKKMVLDGKKEYKFEEPVFFFFDKRMTAEAEVEFFFNNFTRKNTYINEKIIPEFLERVKFDIFISSGKVIETKDIWNNIDQLSTINNEIEVKNIIPEGFLEFARKYENKIKKTFKGKTHYVYFNIKEVDRIENKKEFFFSRKAILLEDGEISSRFENVELLTLIQGKEDETIDKLSEIKNHIL